MSTFFHKIAQLEPLIESEIILSSFFNTPFRPTDAGLKKSFFLWSFAEGERMRNVSKKQ